MESDFQKDFIKEIKRRFPGCIVMKNDPNYIQGIPDLLVLYKKHWAALECKDYRGASKRPNQSYYVATMNQMSYATFVYPENQEDVLNDLERTFRSRRSTRAVRS
jgi:hypothetical protein